MIAEPKLNDVELTDVHDVLTDIAEGLAGIATAARAAAEHKPGDIKVAAPNVSVAAPEVNVTPHIDVHVPAQSKVESFLVHDIKRDDSKLITSFKITVQR